VSEPAEAGGPPEPSVATGPPPERWLAACRRAVEAHREIFRTHRGIAERTRYEGIGEGGDRTLAIDRMCEDAVFAELESVHAEGFEFKAIAEERGEVTFGDGSAASRVVIDPIDGSLNARRTIPCHSLSIGVAEGDSMEDVTFGYVYEFGVGEEYLAVRGQGAELDGEPLAVPGGDRLELVALEAAQPERIRAASEALAGKAYRLRTPGSIAVSLCYVAAGRFDGMMSTRPCRSVDAAGGQLILREAGGELAFGDAGLSSASLGLEARYRLAAARTGVDLRTLLDAMASIP
jgi:myo-inositol-1(or 4)-monophosphatase